VPGAHSRQACVEEEEKLPALQALHDEAPVTLLVMLPAAQVRQAKEDELPVEGL